MKHLNKINLCIFLLLFSGKLFSEPIWEYYPELLEVKSPIYKGLRIDKNSKKVYFGNLGSGKANLHIFDLETKGWEKISLQQANQATVNILGFELDKDNNLWIASNGNGVQIYDGSDNIKSLHELFSGFFIDPQTRSYGSPLFYDANNNMWMGYGTHIFKMQKDKLTHYSTDSILPGKVIIKEKIIVNKNRLYIEDAHYPTDSVCIINTDNMKLINTITYKTQKNDTGIIRELYLHKDELYVVVDENGTNFGKRPKLKIYKLADNKIEKVKFDYLDTLKEYYINCFTFDEEDNLILFLSVFEDQVDNYGHGEIVYFKDGLMKKRIRTPKVRHNNQQLKSYDIAVEMATYNNEIWMASNMYGILRMTNASDVKEDVIVNFGRDVEITSISPNPSSSQVTLNYFCHPAKQQELKVEAVDILGRKISIDDYHILNYDSSTGLGTMTLNISQLNLGVSIITLNLYNSKAGKVFYRN